MKHTTSFLLVLVCVAMLSILGCEPSPSSSAAETPAETTPEPVAVDASEAASSQSATASETADEAPDEAKPAAKSEQPSPPADDPMAVAAERSAKRQQAIEAEGEETTQECGKLTVDKTEHDFGQIEPRERCNTEFMLKNEGPGPIVIKKRIGRSCGCTVPTLDKYELGPGESTPLKVVYNSSSHPGTSRKRITVKTEEPCPQTMVLTIKAEVREVITYEPKTWQFEFRQSEKNTQPLVLESTQDKAFRILEVNSTNGVVSVEYDSEQAATKHTLPITVNQDKLRQTRMGTVTVKVDDPAVRQITARFTAVMPFVAQPSSLFFRDMESGASRTDSLLIKSNYDEPFEVTNIEVEKDLATVDKQEATEEGHKITVTLTAPDDTNTRFVKDTLTITLKSEAGEETLTVPCYGRMPRNIRYPKPGSRAR